jgi:hypothetical protein
MSGKQGIHTEVSGDASRRAANAAKNIKNWVRTATGDIANEAGRYIKNNFLHGRALNLITGQTHDSVKQWYSKKDDSWYIRPGVGITGSLGYLAKWIGTSHEFMAPGFKEFLGTRDVSQEIAKKVERRL